MAMASYTCAIAATHGAKQRRPAFRRGRRNADDTPPPPKYAFVAHKTLLPNRQHAQAKFKPHTNKARAHTEPHRTTWEHKLRKTPAIRWTHAQFHRQRKPPNKMQASMCGREASTRNAARRHKEGHGHGKMLRHRSFAHKCASAIRLATILVSRRKASHDVVAATGCGEGGVPESRWAELNKADVTCERASRCCSNASSVHLLPDLTSIEDKL